MQNSTNWLRVTKSVKAVKFHLQKLKMGQRLGHFVQTSAFRDPNFTVLTEFFFNDLCVSSLWMAKDTIEVLNARSPKKASINGKSSEKKETFWNIFE